MKPLILGEKLTSILDSAYTADASLKTAYGKIKNILQDYAEEKRIKYEELLVLHISDENGEIQPDLLRFIESAPRLPRQTNKRYRRYISEKESGIRRLIRALTDTKLSHVNGKNRPVCVLPKPIPDHIKPLLEKLPCVRGNAAGRSNKQKLASKLTLYGQLLLSAVCRVDDSKGLGKETPAIKDLLWNHYKEIRAELRSLAPSLQEFKICVNSLRTLLKKFGLTVSPLTAITVDVQDWPEPLKSQHHQYKQLATGEASPSPTLQESAAKHGCSLKTHGKETRSLVTNRISQVLAMIPHNSTLSIIDLIRLQPTEVMTEEGPSVVPRNANIDHVRKIEQSKSTPRKRVNYDSELFRDFLFAIKSIAARTGFGHLIKDFNQAYQVRLDKESRQAWKRDKKKGIPRRWVDAEIARIGEEFDGIVKRRLFARVPGRKKAGADRAMRLCLFYVQLLTMRFVGYRQQAIRGCWLDRNIIFLKDGTIILHFDEDEVKNRRTLHFEIKPTAGGTHERLRQVLVAYRKKIIPYIQKHRSNELENRFFAQFDGHSGQFRGFEDADDYGKFFKARVAEFLNVKDLAPRMRDAFNAHFLRGVCTDWMIYDLHMTYAEAARVLGDTEAVVRRDYADRNEVYDATSVFDKINMARGTALTT